MGDQMGICTLGKAVHPVVGVVVAAQVAFARDYPSHGRNRAIIELVTDATISPVLTNIRI